MQPITYFIQTPGTEALCVAFGYYLEDLSREHQLCLIQAISTTILCEGGLEACLLEAGELADDLLPEALLPIFRQIEAEGNLEHLLLAVTHQVCFPAQVAIAGGS